MMTRFVQFTICGFGTAALLASAACTNAPKHEEQSLVAAVDRFRAAEDGTEPAALAAIKAASCSDGEKGPICSAKAACLLYAEPTTSAKTRMADVKRTLDADAAIDPMTKSLLDTKLIAARSELEFGHKALEDCDRQLQDLRLKYER